MKPGPKPAPRALRLLRGTRDRSSRGVRAGAKATTSKPPAPPAHLSVEAKRIWRKAAKILHDAGVLTPLDHAVLEVFCCELAAYRAATKLTAAGIVIKGARGGSVVKNPARSIAGIAATNVRLLGGELGLSPSARSGESASPPSALDRFT